MIGTTFGLDTPSPGGHGLGEGRTQKHCKILFINVLNITGREFLIRWSRVHVVHRPPDLRTRLGGSS